MIRTNTRSALLMALGLLAAPPLALAQSVDSPMTRLRPIGSSSAVDQYRTPAREAYRPAIGQVRQAEFADGTGARHTVRQTQFDAPQLPNALQLPNSFAPPVAPPVTQTLPPGPVPTTPFPTMQFPTTQFPSTPRPSTSVQPIVPRGLPLNPGNFAPVPVGPSGPISSNSDLAPLAQPQLNGDFATVGNCPCVSPPSSYVAASGPCSTVSYQGPVSYAGPQTYVAPPTQIAAPVVVAVAPVPDRRAGIPRGPLINFGQNRNPVQVGQGIVGQPVAYVPGQRFRNWIRYVFP
jgi:hypothetical protein